MTEFEQQVADALNAVNRGDVAAGLMDGRWTLGEMWAPRVAAAIEAVLNDCAEGTIAFEGTIFWTPPETRAVALTFSAVTLHEVKQT